MLILVLTQARKVLSLARRSRRSVGLRGLPWSDDSCIKSPFFYRLTCNTQPGARRPFHRSLGSHLPVCCLIGAVAVPEHLLHEILFIGGDEIVEGDDDRQEGQRKQGGRGHGQGQVNQEAAEIQGVADIAEGPGGDQGSGQVPVAAVADNLVAEAYQQEGRGQQQAGRGQPQGQRYVGSREGGVVQDKRIQNPDKQEQDQEDQLPHIAVRVLAVRFSHVFLSPVT